MTSSKKSEGPGAPFLAGYAPGPDVRSWKPMSRHCFSKYTKPISQEETMMYRKTRRLTAVCVCAAATVVSAQINLLSNSINFRTSTTNNQVTQHYGLMKVMANNPAGNSKLLEIVDQTPAGTAVNSYHYGVYYDGQANWGTGGFFAAKTYGLMAQSLNTGAYFLGVNTTADVTTYKTVTGMRADAMCATSGNAKMTAYGIYAVAPTYNMYASYAGYFNGNLAYTGNLTKVSDEKYKKNIEPMMGSLDKLLRLKPCKYDYRADEYKNINLPKDRQLGLVAQELEDVFPEVVHVDVAPQAPSEDNAKDAKGKKGEPGSSETAPETYKSVDYVSLIPVLIQAIQEQQSQIEQLKAGQGYK